MTDVKVRAPWALVGDPTNHPIMLMHDNGDGTFSLKVNGGVGGSTPTLAEVLAAGAIADVPILFSGGGVLDGGGAIYMEADSDESGLSGSLSLNPVANGGNAQIQGGFHSSTGTGATFGAGAAIAAGNGAGTANISGGNAAGGTGKAGGDIILTPGAKDGAGRNGLVFLNLPTSDPHVAGAAWANAGVVMVSAG